MRSRIAQSLRWVPFVAGAGTSLWVAAGLPHGRKPFEVDLMLSRESLALSMGKVPHYLSIALLFGLACVATGLRRPALAFGLTMLVGLGWELAESTAIGHTARAADLAPDLVAALACLLVLLVVRRWRPKPGNEILP
jgi:hypothetical protein